MDTGWGDRVRLTGISSRAWEVPGERGALAALRTLEGYDELRAALADAAQDAAAREQHLAAGVRVDERQLGWVHRLFREAADALDVAGLPELVVVPDPLLRARTIGVQRPLVVLTSGLLDRLDQDELRFVLGGQLGHAISGHAPHRTLLDRLGATTWPLNPSALMVRSALGTWAHQAEVSADRAALLATQDPTVALATFMALAAPGRVGELDAASFQAQEAEVDTSPVDPAGERPVGRAAALRRWLDTGVLHRARQGDYPRREDDASAPPDEDARREAAAYAEAFLAARDRLDGLLSATGTGGVRRWLEGTFRRS